MLSNSRMRRSEVFLKLSQLVSDQQTKKQKIGNKGQSISYASETESEPKIGLTQA